ncbi:Dynamin-like GTPase that mediates homotypic ER fusion [Serendipita sp. 399]|nr:Dynamin-like GTPase that mediates homotypic ER fusion [Serendipita sp. 399]
MHTTLHPLFYSQVKNISKLTLSRFKASLGGSLKGDAGYDFAEVVSEAKKNGVAAWDETTREMLVVVDEQGGEWLGGWEEERALLVTEMGHVADVFRKDETTKMVNQLERSLRNQLADPVDIALSKPGLDMWDRVLTAFNDLLGKAEASYLTKATAFNCSPEENDTALTTLRRRAWTALLNKTREHTADAALLARLRSSFEEQFRYDENGVPRVWRPDDDIESVFKKARDATLDLVPTYARISPLDPNLLPANILSDADMPSDFLSNSNDELDFTASLVLLSEPKQLDLTSRFRRDADAYYVEAKRSTVSSVAQIPYWMYGVLVVLGWNEAMIVLFNPLYFAMMLGLLGAAWVIIQLNLVGPLYAVTKTVTGEVQRQITARLREHFSEPIPPLPEKPGNDVAEEIELKRREDR